MEHEEEDSRISKYSSGINILKRLDVLWRDTHAHSREGRYNKWNEDLDRIWLELARDLKDKTKDEKMKYDTVKSKFDEFDGKIEKLGFVSDLAPEGFKELQSEDIKNRNKYYGLLMDKQLFLARLENQIGKGTTLEDDDDDDII